MEKKPINLEELRHRLGHVLGYVRAAEKETQENQGPARALLGHAIVKLEESLSQLDLANEQKKSDES